MELALRVHIHRTILYLGLHRVYFRYYLYRMGQSASQAQIEAEIKKVEVEIERIKKEQEKKLEESKAKLTIKENTYNLRIIAEGDDVRKVKQNPNDVIPGFT